MKERPTGEKSTKLLFSYTHTSVRSQQWQPILFIRTPSFCSTCRVIPQYYTSESAIFWRKQLVVHKLAKPTPKIPINPLPRMFYFNKSNQDAEWSKVLWTYLHLRSLYRVGVLFPTVPHYSFPVQLAMKVETIQIGAAASVVPPGAPVTHSTWAASILVIIAILGGKWIATMITKRISSSAWA